MDKHSKHNKHTSNNVVTLLLTQIMGPLALPLAHWPIGPSAGLWQGTKSSVALVQETAGTAGTAGVPRGFSWPRWLCSNLFEFRMEGVASGFWVLRGSPAKRQALDSEEVTSSARFRPGLGWCLSFTATCLLLSRFSRGFFLRIFSWIFWVDPNCFFFWCFIATSIAGKRRLFLLGRHGLVSKERTPYGQERMDRFLGKKVLMELDGTGWN